MSPAKLRRSFDTDQLAKDMLPYAEVFKGFDPEDWKEGSSNIVLTDGEGNYALFYKEKAVPNLYFGHYFLLARGKVAVEKCKAFLREIFKPEYSVEVIHGLTPLTKLGALWMNRKLGFTNEGIVQTTSGPCQLVSLTKQQWEELDGRNSTINLRG